MTGAVNLLVWAMSALLAPFYEWVLGQLSEQSQPTLMDFTMAAWLWIAAIAIALILALFIKEPDRSRR